MYFRKAALYLILIVFLLCITGCSEKKTVEIPALVVIDIIPERVQEDLFEKNILKSAESGDTEIIEKAYELDEESGEYIADMKAENMNELLNIFRKINYAPLFSDPKAENLVSLVTEWTEITCLTPKNKPKSVKALDASGKEKTYEWYNIKAGADEGWILSDYLLFKSIKETEAIVIDTFRIFSKPDCIATRVEGSCTRGETITLTGYKYEERNCSTKTIFRYSMKTYNESGWGYGPNILTDAHIGVILPDEVTLYTAPKDMKQNVDEKVIYKKMDFVPIINILENEWYEVIYYDKNKPYYIKSGNEVISSKKDDISFASYIWENYHSAKEIIDTVLKAQESDPVGGVAKISDKSGKIDKLNTIYEDIEKYQNDYPDSIFAGIGPYSLREFIQNLMVVKDVLENNLTESEEKLPVMGEEDKGPDEIEAEIDESSGE